ncbi:MAG TPA: galactose-1-phosphate uridylyltransferase [Candidatus Angelobacter sp.]
MKGSELRQDPATKEWVVIAPERSQRPQQDKRSAEERHTLYSSHCPFCPGNESLTPPELLRIGHEGWQVRVVPNKFPALHSNAGPVGRNCFFRSAPGSGHHEVIIESPAHNLELADTPEEHIARILRAYQQRQRFLLERDDVRCVVIFRNYGERAGTSLLHPHSQVLATPVVPAFVHWKHEVAEHYWEENNRNLYADICEAERWSEMRMVEEDRAFTAFVPFASFVPYEMWIVPKRFTPSFALASDAELADLAGTLRRCLLRLRECCGNVHYNYVIHSCTRGLENEDFYLWHLQIIPRLTEPAGFEMGSHMYINPMLPEQCAQNLRNAAITIAEPAGVSYELSA